MHGGEAADRKSLVEAATIESAAVAGARQKAAGTADERIDVVEFRESEVGHPLHAIERAILSQFNALSGDVAELTEVQGVGAAPPSMELAKPPGKNRKSSLPVPPWIARMPEKDTVPKRLPWEKLLPACATPR